MVRNRVVVTEKEFEQGKCEICGRKPINWFDNVFFENDRWISQVFLLCRRHSIRFWFKLVFLSFLKRPSRILLSDETSFDIEKKQTRNNLKFLRELNLEMSKEALGEGLKSELEVWIDNLELSLEKNLPLTEREKGALDIFDGIHEYWEEYASDYDPLMAEMGMYKSPYGDDLGI